MSGMTPEERRDLIEAVTHAMTAAIGPTGDMTRAVIAAKVDGLIDARKRFVAAGWPEWLIHSALTAFITGSGAPVAFQVASEPDDEST